MIAYQLRTHIYTMHLQLAKARTWRHKVKLAAAIADAKLTLRQFEA